MLNEISKMVNKTVKEIWINNIAVDYEKGRLYREASLQDCFYFHLRREIGDSVLEAFNIFIYPEYYYQNKYVDIAVIIKENEKEIPIAIFEFKYLNSTADLLFYKDVLKVIEFSNKDNFCKYYLGFIQEVEYNFPEDYSWLNVEQRSLASGGIIEMTGGFCKPQENKTSWFIKEHI